MSVAACCVRIYTAAIVLCVGSVGGIVWGGFVLLFEIILCVWTVLVVLYGQFVLFFEIIPSVDSTGGTVWAVCIVV